ncbi:MAG TPA: DUF3300 domain-containing protein [Stellaceae bacterium]|nr:DUF3300 domain-containing protein [Stellaceae bacterium]
MTIVRALVCALALWVAAPSLLQAQAPGPASPPAPEAPAAPSAPQAPATPPSPQAPSAQQAPAPPVYSVERLDQLLAPIALYPDALIAQVLAASTYPLEVIEAYRWQQESGHADLKGDPLDAALKEKDWDPSVKSLIPFPQVLRMMNDRLDWMQQLGDAFLAQPGDVMDSVQRLRRAAEKSGSIKSSPQQTITHQNQDVVIAPADPNNVYVPVYDPTVVYGAWPYPAYPPYYWWPPDFAYGPAYWPGWWWWWPPVVVSFYGPYWGWANCNWHNHSIFIDHGRFDHINGPHPHAMNGNTWQHDPYHRRGVTYRDPATAAKYGRPMGAPDARRSYRGFQPTPSTTPRGRSGSMESGQPQVFRGSSGPQGKTGGQGSGQTQVLRGGTGPRPNASQRTLQPAFGGYGSGANTRAQSDRGRSSQQTMAPHQAAPSVSAPRSQGAPSGGSRAPSGGGNFGGGGFGGGGGGGHR